MKFKYLLGGLFGLAAVFAAAMIYLVYFGETSETGTALEANGATDIAGPPLRGNSRTVSGKDGRLTIAYAGDITGSLDPCG